MPYIPNAVISGGPPGSQGPAGEGNAFQYSLASSTAIGDSSLTLDRVVVAPATSLKLVAIAPYTSNCEIRKISSIVGTTVNLVTAKTVTASTISFDGTAETITYSGGLGSYFIGAKVVVSGSASNDGTFTVTALSAGNLTITVAENIVTEAAGASVTLRIALCVAHSSGDPVLFMEGGVVPAEIYGVQADGDTGNATANLTGLQRAANEYIWASQTSAPLGALAGVRLAPGTTYINGEWFPEHAMVVEGASVDLSILKATGMSFADEEVAVLHLRRLGDPCEYGAPGPSARLYLRNILIDGSGISGANGILASVQQPAYWESVRVINCPGYGIAICDTQQHVMHNIETTACGIGLVYQSAEFCWVNALNIEQSTIGDFLAEMQSGGAACDHNHFIGVHLESPLGAGQKSFNILSGDGWMFKNVWYSNPDTTATLFYFNNSTGVAGKPIFHLKNVRANTTSSSFAMVNDVQRSIIRTSEDVTRYIHEIVSGGISSNWQIEILGPVFGSGLNDPPPKFLNGIRLSGDIFGGSGAPSGGANGDYYFRTDTPGTANQRIYVKSAGSWTGIV